jgi:hypothetical protein
MVLTTFGPAVGIALVQAANIAFQSDTHLCNLGQDNAVSFPVHADQARRIGGRKDATSSNLCIKTPQPVQQVTPPADAVPPTATKF